MGQGGSEGSMNHTRVKDKIFPALEIGSQAKLLWAQHSQIPVNGFTCLQSRRMVIGWSTGGLAAYELAFDKWADSVVLIAPGIHPNKLVGEASKAPALLPLLKPVISERTLTRNTFANQANPHVDPIKPDSPAKVPLFAGNLLATAIKSQFWNVDQGVKGLVFLGTGDTYVDYAATKRTLAKRAPHFSIVQYEGALHELHNEIPQVANDVTRKILDFL
jgi:alpha-beta hydrolase superfamily lysophospholipase